VTGHPTPATFTFKGTEIAYVSRGTFSDTFTGTVTVHVQRLRSKIELDPKSPHHLETVWGVGYRFVP